MEKGISSEEELDLIDLGKKLWLKRKFILKVSLVGLVVGVVVAFSIPKEYTTTVILAPEANAGSTTGNAGALAAMAGINLSGNAPDGDIAPELYPYIIESTPFIMGLFNVRVQDLDNEVDTTLYFYIKDEQRSAWWSKIMKLPRGIIGLFSTENKAVASQSINNFSLTKEQTDVFNNLKDRITLTVDKKTGIITLTSTMQDPNISAGIADTLTSYLQSYIISYRTQKARQDLAFTETLYAEAKKDYSDAQQKYARYLDENQNVILASYRVNQERLQNEMTLTYGVYNQVAQQLQLAKVKVQDITPVYTTIQPAIMPLIPAKPNKKLIVIGFIFLTIIGACGYVLIRNFLKTNTNTN
ncbi:chain-length determining protein [Dysgonomonas sp. HDW5B]|uniref:Wzz/FepE/Etk N-terminal domain-containing protein n=1 Tax=Dysgonomonas sp. HDW5B TaxID=2714927 RepID=UPI00140DE596|nr:Wzz/FepE/Etk N-terminal domain-containing protein [Dysgonomonas sp. HDW5B]QIK54150.1 chain-length determining protein [Dysgonomonas sp. HDW5B]